VAHDFNNLLTAIKCNTGFLLEGCPGCGARLEEVAEIDRAADRATALTGQLLAFSRRQVIRPREVDVDVLLAGLERMLSRLVPENIQQELTLGANRAHVRIDPGQLEQVVLNLVVNARDAMADGGKLEIRTCRAALASTDARRFGGAAVTPGAYAHISVRDTGSGMDAATLARVFEPFFTTKPAGVGTGLGLSTVYGIVKQNRGYVSLESAPGAGTTVGVYLPLVPAPAPEEPPEPEQRPAAGGTETILLVEDEPAIRAVANRALGEHGYTVLAASDGAHALALAEAHGWAIDLLVTDVVMPAMSGRELAERLCEGRARMPVLFMSGYSESNAYAGALAPGTNLLNKPFTPRELLERVRGALDGSEDGWG
jgi:CheY-like chemotaxis protein